MSSPFPRAAERASPRYNRGQSQNAPRIRVEGQRRLGGRRVHQGFLFLPVLPCRWTAAALIHFAREVAMVFERRVIAIHGVVQGVGFRPFVYGLAQQLDLKGFVRNRTGGVLIEVEGKAASLDHFLNEVSLRPPPLARIDRLTWERRSVRGESGFQIAPSEAQPSPDIFISPDAAACDACVAELFDPGDRRFGYPFLNCTNCGPRLTIVTGAPYDRERTTMAGFRMCPACRAEYEDPADRRFHAQPTACADCGPNLALADASGKQ